MNDTTEATGEQHPPCPVDGCDFVASVTRPSAEAQLEWVRRHGLDADLIPLGTHIVIDRATRTVTVEECVRRADNGRLLVERVPRPDGGVDIAVVLRRRTVQLEGPALPFPPWPEDVEEQPVRGSAMGPRW
jgi:hypothetical protein